MQKFKLKKLQIYPFPHREIRSKTNDRYTGTYYESINKSLTKRVWKSHLHHQKRVKKAQKLFSALRNSIQHHL